MGLVFIIYLVGVLPSVGKALCFLGFIGGVYSVAVHLITASGPYESDSDKKFISAIKGTTFLKTFIFIWFLGFLIPNEKTMYTMLAAYGVQEIVTNPKVQELGGKSLEVLEKAMDEYIGEDKGEEK